MEDLLPARSGTPQAGRPGRYPALFTRMSSSWKALSRRRRELGDALRCRDVSRDRVALPERRPVPRPRGRMSSALREETITRAPACTRPRAIISPIPREPPSPAPSCRRCRTARSSPGILCLPAGRRPRIADRRALGAGHRTVAWPMTAMAPGTSLTRAPPEVIAPSEGQTKSNAHRPRERRNLRSLGGLRFQRISIAGAGFEPATFGL